MKVRCVIEDYYLKLDREYTVYAISIFEGSVWYAIREYDSRCTAYFRPASLFNVIDNRLSRYWVFSQENTTSNTYTLCAFPEWAEDFHFYENVIEGFCKENQILYDYMKLMDLEFPDPEILEMAQIGNNEWLICPTCIDAWESSNHDAWVRCPKCYRTYKNPRYPWENEPKDGKVKTFLPPNKFT